MTEGAAKPQFDELFVDFLNARSEAESEAVLEGLVLEYAQPLIRSIISFRLKEFTSPPIDNRDIQEVEDVSHEVILRLVRTLRHCKSSPQEKSITSLRSYVAVMAYNASDEYLREKYPRRFSLKNKIRYILTHQPKLALWEGESRKTLCGLARWAHVQKAEASSLRQARGDLHDFLRERFPAAALEELNPAELVIAVCEFANSPMWMDELVTVMAEILGIRDMPPRVEPENNGFDDRPQLSFDPRGLINEASDHQAKMQEVRARLERIWKEMIKLPIRQRVALLMNLKDEDGEPAITLLPMLRIASIQQIAEALEMPAQELAAVWSRLPLEDAAIGEKLGATRQQVSNLRKCARERLARRLKLSGGQ